MKDKDLRMTLSINARKKAEQFSLDAMCGKYADLFDEILYKHMSGLAQ